MSYNTLVETTKSPYLDEQERFRKAVQTAILDHWAKGRKVPIWDYNNKLVKYVGPEDK